MTLHFDLFTITIFTAVVVVVAGVTFIADTFARHEDISGRIWTLAFLAGMLTVVCYLFWAGGSGGQWAIAIGNAAYVASAGCMWVGSRAYNRRPGFFWVLVVVVTVLEAVIVVAQGPNGGSWAGGGVMFIAIAVFATAGGIESLTGTMGRNANARSLAIVLLLQGVYYAVRSVVFFVAGPDSELFTKWFSTVSSSFITTTLVMVAAISMAVLRADRAPLRGWRRADFGAGDDEPAVSANTFEGVATDWLEQSARGRASVAVIVARYEALDAVTTALGKDAADDLCAEWTRSIRAHAPSFSVITEQGPGSLLIMTCAESRDEVVAAAARLVDGLLEPDVAMVAGIRPTVTVGGILGLASLTAASLIEQAESAVATAIATGESVVVTQAAGSRW